MDDLIAKALHAARHHLAGGGLLSGPDYLSTGEVASPTEWGNPDVASDFFKADRALRWAREIQAREEPPLTAPRPGAVEARDLPPPATAPIAYGPEPEKNPARVAINEATKLTGRAPQEMTGADLASSGAQKITIQDPGPAYLRAIVDGVKVLSLVRKAAEPPQTDKPVEVHLHLKSGEAPSEEPGPDDGNG